ncbi:hypothetical protein AHAS_Ahas15G0248200 [Arachis hypogaea]
MIVYFHESINKIKSVDTISGPPWVQYWTREKLVERIEAKMKDKMGIVRRTQLRDQSKKKEKEGTKEATKGNDCYIALIFEK